MKDQFCQSHLSIGYIQLTCFLYKVPHPAAVVVFTSVKTGGKEHVLGPGSAELGSVPSHSSILAVPPGQ